jgi:uncharacterized heparinase superfamily protein
MRVGLYIETIRYLRYRQIYERLRRALRRIGVSAKNGVVRSGVGRWCAFLPPPDTGGPDSFSFLNVPAHVSAVLGEWDGVEVGKLWRYNLHYFDYLHWPSFDPETKQALINDWINSCPPGMPDAWEPYPLSLRVVNWIKYWLSGVPPTQDQLDSAASQLAWLSQDLEYHLLANHLLKNGKALLFGGLYFEGPEARSWLDKGLEILLAEADEQVLPDGGHFERSPMYHCIVLEDYLDAVNLARASPGLVPASAVEKLAATARRGAGFLQAITAGDGRIPLFNDAAFGITPEPDQILEYARRVLGEGALSAPEPGARRISLPDTGYFGYRRGGDSLIVDCGPVGPDYQPGHAHCDTLSYELCVDGQRVVVDAGVYGYEADDRRHYARRTSSHNTVEVDGAEQSEIWAAFRVARRARPLEAVLSDWEGGVLTFRGAHDGYRRLPGRPIHSRQVRMDPAAGAWEIRDTIAGSGKARHRVVSSVHLGFDISVRPEATSGVQAFLLRHNISGLQLRLSVICGSPARVEDGYHFPEFGLCRDNKVIVIEREGPFPLQMQYRIEKIP